MKKKIITSIIVLVSLSVLVYHLDIVNYKTIPTVVLIALCPLFNDSKILDL